MKRQICVASRNCRGLSKRMALWGGYAPGTCVSWLDNDSHDCARRSSSGLDPPPSRHREAKVVLGETRRGSARGHYIRELRALQGAARTHRRCGSGAAARSSTTRSAPRASDVYPALAKRFSKFREDCAWICQVRITNTLSLLDEPTGEAQLASGVRTNRGLHAVALEVKHDKAPGVHIAPDNRTL
jgi:hypothetical protein